MSGNTQCAFVVFSQKCIHACEGLLSCAECFGVSKICPSVSRSCKLRH